VASSPRRKVAIDACCFLLTITGQPGAQECARLLDAVWDDRLDLVESPAILVEVLPRHDSDDGSGKRQLVLAQLESSHVQFIDLSTTIARKAAEISVGYPKVKNLDAIHLATAIIGEADLFVTTNSTQFPMGECLDGVLVVTPAEALSRLEGLQMSLFDDGPCSESTQ
jgi:hypothetical protein